MSGEYVEFVKKGKIVGNISEGEVTLDVELIKELAEKSDETAIIAIDTEKIEEKEDGK